MPDSACLLPVRPHGRVAGCERCESLLVTVTEPPQPQLAHTVALGTKQEPLAVSRRLRMIMKCAVSGVRKLFGRTIERYAKQLHAWTDFRRIENRVAIGGPDRRVAASAMEIKDIEKLDHAA